MPGVLVRPPVARRQLDEETKKPPEEKAGDEAKAGQEQKGEKEKQKADVPKRKRFHGTVSLDPTRVGRDAGRIAEEIISHLTAPVGSKVTVTLEIEARFADGVPEDVVRTVTENCRALKFSSQEFEKE